MIDKPSEPDMPREPEPPRVEHPVRRPDEARGHDGVRRESSSQPGREDDGGDYLKPTSEFQRFLDDFQAEKATRIEEAGGHGELPEGRNYLQPTPEFQRFLDHFEEEKASREDTAAEATPDESDLEIVGDPAEPFSPIMLDGPADDGDNPPHDDPPPDTTGVPTKPSGGDDPDSGAYASGADDVDGRQPALPDRDASTEAALYEDATTPVDPPDTTHIDNTCDAGDSNGSERNDTSDLGATPDDARDKPDNLDDTEWNFDEPGAIPAMETGDTVRLRTSPMEREVYGRDQAFRRADKNMAVEADDDLGAKEARARQTNNAMRMGEREADRVITAAFGPELERLHPPALPEAPDLAQPEASADRRSDRLNRALDSDFDQDPESDPAYSEAAAAAQADAAGGVFSGSFSSRSREFDFVYRMPNLDGDGDSFVVVEAKGGAGRYGSKEIAPGVRAEQGTNAYLEKTIDEITARGDAPWAAELRHALDDGRVSYYGVRVPYDSRTPDAREAGTRDFLSDTVFVDRFPTR